MDIVSPKIAMQTLNNETEAPIVREKAVQFLAVHPDPQAIALLVQALVDDDFGVRWEAAIALSRLGREALPALLTALTDPERVGDPRLRASAYRILEHMNIPGANHSIWKLMEAIKGPAADIATMEEAYKMLQVLQKVK